MNSQQYNISNNNFEQCIKCTICTVYCPVVPINHDFPGPKQAGPDGERFRLKTPDFFDPTLKYCLNCKRCEVSCPSGVRIGDIIQAARIKYSRSKPKLRDIMLANTDIVGTMSTKLAPVVNATLKLSPVKKVMDTVLQIDHRRTFPKYASQTFENWYHQQAEAKQDSYQRHVSYFHGCYVNYNFPQLGKDLVKVMNAIGYGVHLLEYEKCCGVALISNGLISQAKKQALHNIKAIRQSVIENNRPVLATSSTCVFTLRDEYPHLLDIDNADVRQSTELATRFIFRLVESGEVKLAFKKDYHNRIAYHTPCHMEKLGWSIYSTSLLRMIPGMDFVMLNSQCCGIAGTYGFKKENYETSQGIGNSLFRQIQESHVSYVATDCETCKWQIEMSTPTRVMNPISILADALDLEATIALNRH
ncbi:anaerobic glycerol-3-phosphate dehydrogenase subunit GlpC [Bacteroides bouchesdurhonensis]|mgnify:FL=1|uniref:anaerobic glycerol-3-phosphate dehydrogenase subunit GlpC n=1 Tax=Bacteroides bouchesdurhonensis TaxID=1841855 RepID=UPI00097F7702|nr:anaerobic glycerol-3-phosphate dehydrogenase subunit GlpC [Bacteroides bouchesdurhonensis]